MTVLPDKREHTNDKEIPKLKILIVSTWKTGNTWLKHLLAEIYNLPVCYVPDKLERDALNKLGPEWVIHQHFSPEIELIEWASQNEVTLITTLRHPGDVLVSLCHYVANCPDDFRNFQIVSANHKASILSIGLQPDKLDNTLEHVQHYFYQALAISLSWLETGLTYPVRYEELLQNPLKVLTELTDKLQPVPVSKLERAIEQNTLGMLREVSGRGNFFRSGRAGDWEKELPGEIVQLFKTQQPYPDIFARLGYSLKPSETEVILPMPIAKSHNPFKSHKRFDNGVLVPAVVARLYLSLDPTLTERWLEPAATSGKNTFYNWLNEPATKDPLSGENLPLISNLADYIYNLRHDCQEMFPDIYGKDRLFYSNWFIRQSPLEYKLDVAFFWEMRRTLIKWATTPSPLDPYLADKTLPVITNLAVSVYQTKPDIASLYPDIFRENRGVYVLWLLQHAPGAYKLDPVFLVNTEESFKEWSLLPAEKELSDTENLPPLSNMLLCCYKFREDCQAAFPDIFGRDRLIFIEWLIVHGRNDFKLNWDFVTQLQNTLD